MVKKILLLLVVISFISAEYGLDAKSSQKKAPGIALEDTKGQFKMLSSLLSDTNIILSFWSYDCVPCRKEMPELQKMADSELFKEKNVKLIFVYVEATTAKTKQESAEKTPKEKAIEVLEILKIKEMCLLDIYGVAYNNYREAGNIKNATMPLLFLVNKDKDIVYKAIGYNEKNLQKLEDSIKKKL